MALSLNMKSFFFSINKAMYTFTRKRGNAAVAAGRKLKQMTSSLYEDLPPERHANQMDGV